MASKEAIETGGDSVARAQVALAALQVEADETARWRGHILGLWTASGTHAHADCTMCDAGVTVDANPPANGIDIAGRAVAVSCGGPRD